MRQYIPTKHSKFGINLWMLTEEVSGYCYHFNVYRGKRFDQTPAGESQGSYVIMSLMRAADLLNKLYHAFCDSFLLLYHWLKRYFNIELTLQEHYAVTDQCQI